MAIFTMVESSPINQGRKHGSINQSEEMALQMMVKYSFINQTKMALCIRIKNSLINQGGKIAV